MRIAWCSHPYQHWLFKFCLIGASFTGYCFDMHFPNDMWWNCIFHYHLDIYMCSLRMFLLISPPIFMGLNFFPCKVLAVLSISLIWTHYLGWVVRIYIYIYIILDSRIFLILWGAESFYFVVIPLVDLIWCDSFVYLCFSLLCQWCWILEAPLTSVTWIGLPIFSSILLLTSAFQPYWFDFCSWC